jgi:CDP-diacylglycerol--glycerol-3-phosphate 3-phosphatidyltransferase
MANHQAKVPRGALWNVPDQLTCLRLVLAVVLFCLIPLQYYLTCTALFLLAAASDWLDGWYARKYGVVTVLGRILDPFADKVIICGTFIFLLAEPGMAAIPYGLRAWMVVVIVGRELLVTVLRGLIEQQGTDFSAKWSGKLKMGFQCGAAAGALFYLSLSEPAAWLRWTLVAAIWTAVSITVYSGVQYVFAAARLLSQEPAETR